MKKVLVIFIMIACVSVFARIGETKEECIKRYGQPTSEVKDSNTVTVVFLKNDIKIEIIFYQGKAEYIKYRSIRIQESSPLDCTGGTADKTVFTLLNSNYSGGWIIQNNTSALVSYTSKNKLLEALYWGSIENLEIFTVEYKQRDEKEKLERAKADEARKLNGF
ncbi:MAG: hypothetical protein WCH76_08070 [Candidatus Riflemargulisbacteria bacterium]